MSENGEKALIHEALRDLRQEVRSVSSEVAELRVEVSALGVGTMNERLGRVEDRQDEMRENLTCMLQSQRSLRRQVEKWLPYAILAAFGGAEITGVMLPDNPVPVAEAATE